MRVQSRIQNPVKHLRLELFSQNAPSFLFGRVLNTLLSTSGFTHSFEAMKESNLT